MTQILTRSPLLTSQVRDSVDVTPSQETCKPCHPLALCPLNSTTLPTMLLQVSERERKREREGGGEREKG